MAHWICEICSTGFERSRSGDRPRRFCSQKCYHAWRASEGITTGQFTKGLVPWNKNVKGIHMSPKTEFKKGRESLTWCRLGTVRIRHRRKDRSPRAWTKIANPNIWQLRARVVWEVAYGPIPKGLVLHHIDRDTLNDALPNLAAISRAAHMREHREEREPNRLAGLLSRKRNSG